MDTIAAILAIPSAILNAMRIWQHLRKRTR
jgi:hypothetical protein